MNHLTLLQTGERVTRPGDVPFRTPAEELGVAMASQFDSIGKRIDRLILERDLALAAFKIVSEQKAELERDYAELEARYDAATRGRG